MRPELFTIPGTHVTVPGFGAMVMIGFLGGLWWMTRRTAKAKQDPDIVLNLGFIALIFMAIGARTFYVVHYWDTQFKHQPGQVFNFNAGGFEFYGGFIGAFIPCVLYAMHKRLSLRLWTDIMIPTLLFGMGVGRIGCFLAGCCFGAPCPTSLPWAVQFPFGSEAQVAGWEQRRVAMPADVIYVGPEGVPVILAPKAVHALTEVRKQLESGFVAARAKNDKAALARLEYAKTQLDALDEHVAASDLTSARLEAMKANPSFSSPPLHPAQLYSAVGPLLLAWLTNALFYRRKRHGVVFAIGFMLYAVERFIEETIRVDNPVDTFGLTVSQAISVGIFIVMCVWLLVLQKLPLRSPRAVPYVPKDPQKKPEEPTPATA
jgi:phosphatidylglycerol---prolipoprotein diacylglyceryl transferase